MAKRGKITFRNFENRLNRELLQHEVIVDNTYCQWFERGEMGLHEVRHFIVQFSVFSNLFLVAQLKKMINAVDLQEMHKAKEILVNELGCVLREDRHVSAKKTDVASPNYVSTHGTVDGGIFRFRAAHFEWLLEVGQAMGLKFRDLGRRSLGQRSTLFFCDELDRLYGSEDYNVSAGASFAVENWAAAGFWKQLTEGLRIFSEREKKSLPLGFFIWHDRVEDQHREGTREELRELYFGPHPFDEDKFIGAGQKMLDGVAAFWKGLNKDRLRAAKMKTPGQRPNK